MDLSTNVGEDDLHAVVDGQLAADRHREVMAYLAVYPDAAERVTAFFRQRVEMAALREGLADGEPGARLAGLEEALTRVVRQQHRVRRALGAGGLLAAVVAVAAASGWWLTAGGRGEASDATRLASAAPSPAAERGLALAQGLLAEARPVAAEAGDAAILWLQAHVAGRSLKQPNLESLGLRFAGGSTIKGAQGPAIRLVYADEAGRLFNVFVGVKRSGVEFTGSLVPEDHISLTWQQDPLVFSIIAPKGSTRLGEIMRSAGELLDPAPMAADAGLAQASPAGGDTAAATLLAAPGEGSGAAALPGQPSVAPRDTAPEASGGGISKPL